jgi:hypothetical protein
VRKIYFDASVGTERSAEDMPNKAERHYLYHVNKTLDKFTYKSMAPRVLQTIEERHIATKAEDRSNTSPRYSACAKAAPGIDELQRYARTRIRHMILHSLTGYSVSAMLTCRYRL